MFIERQGFFKQFVTLNDSSVLCFVWAVSRTSGGHSKTLFLGISEKEVDYVRENVKTRLVLS